MTTNPHPSFFQRRTDGTVDAWAVTPTGDYAADCETGKTFFTELAQHAKESMNPLIISRVLQAMIEKGAMSGIEIGFLSSLTAQITL